MRIFVGSSIDTMPVSHPARAATLPFIGQHVTCDVACCDWDGEVGAAMTVGCRPDGSHIAFCCRDPRCIHICATEQESQTLSWY